jgi:hypothetical protein
MLTRESSTMPCDFLECPSKKADSATLMKLRGTAAPSSPFSSLNVNMYYPRVVRPVLGYKRNSLPARFAQRPPHRRKLHLAPPFLLDDYIPRYHLLSSVNASKKRSAAYAHLRNCNLCPRLCGVNRYEKTGTCLIGAETVKVNVIAPHFGEGK